MNEESVRQVLASELRYQHQRLVEIRRKDREMKATLERLYDQTWWDQKHSPEELRQHTFDREVAERASSVVRAELYTRKSALESLRTVSDAVRAKQIGRLWS